MAKIGQLVIDQQVSDLLTATIEKLETDEKDDWKVGYDQSALKVRASN